MQTLEGRGHLIGEHIEVIGDTHPALPGSRGSPGRDLTCPDQSRHRPTGSGDDDLAPGFDLREEGGQAGLGLIDIDGVGHPASLKT